MHEEDSDRSIEADMPSHCHSVCGHIKFIVTFLESYRHLGLYFVSISSKSRGRVTISKRTCYFEKIISGLGSVGSRVIALILPPFNSSSLEQSSAVGMSCEWNKDEQSLLAADFASLDKMRLTLAGEKSDHTKITWWLVTFSFYKGAPKPAIGHSTHKNSA